MSDQTTALIEQPQPASSVIRLEEADSLALRDLTRRLMTAQQDAQLAADRAKLAIAEIVIQRQRFVRALADRLGFDETVQYEHDASACTLTRVEK